MIKKNKNVEEISILSYLLLSISFGFLSLLTPCVFPLIPLTVSYFTKNSEKTKKEIFTEAAQFQIGILVSFSLIGFLVSTLYGATGLSKLSTNPYLNLAIFVLFILFALNLFGVFEIYIPSSILNYFENKKNKSSNLFQNLLMSFLFTLTTFTCTLPFIGTVLVSATKGNSIYPLVGMFGFGLSFSMPFLFLAMFPSLLKKMPKSGSWLVRIKAIMGFLELAASLKFFSNFDLVLNLKILPRENFLMIWASIFFVMGIYILGGFHFKTEKPNTEKSFFSVFISICIFYLGFYFLSGISGKNLSEWEAFLPNYTNTISEKKSNTENLVWLDDLDKAKEISKKENKPIFIDFTGYTCTNCRWMEQNIFILDEIKTELKKFVLVKLYTDGEELVHEKNLKYQEDKFETIAQPLYAVLNSEEKIISKFLGMTRNKNEYIQFLHNSILEFNN